MPQHPKPSPNKTSIQFLRQRWLPSRNVLTTLDRTEFITYHVCNPNLNSHLTLTTQIMSNIYSGFPWQRKVITPKVVDVYHFWANLFCPFHVHPNVRVRPGKLRWNLKITCLKRKIIWTKPFFSGFMLIFGGVPQNTTSIIWHGLLWLVGSLFVNFIHQYQGNVWHVR